MTDLLIPNYVALVDRVLDRLAWLADHEQFFAMESFGFVLDPDDDDVWGEADSIGYELPDSPPEECETVACVAGWTLIEASYGLRGATFHDPAGGKLREDPAREAMALLGISGTSDMDMSEVMNLVDLFFDWDQDIPTAIARLKAHRERLVDNDGKPVPWIKGVGG